MLAVSAAVSVESFQPNPNHNNNSNVDIKFHVDEEGFMTDFSDGNDTLLLESIDFDDLFVGFDHHHVDDHGGGDVLLPDLVMDPEILADFSSPQVAVVKTTATTTTTTPDSKKGGDPETGSTVDSPSSSSVVLNPPDGRGSNNGRGGEKGKKSTSSATSTSSAHSNKNTHGKRKVKVDWTPELHRRFVQAVEQLGVDKAVPSRILELMGIDCLTRHNVASHLQKYRSHRKHILAREAEAASWTHRRQVYAAAGGKRDIINHHRRHHHHHHSPSWHPPTIGFPPPSATVATPAPPPPPPPMHPHPHGHLVRPLHVWGHPSSMDVQAHHPIHIWPKHQDPSFWHHHHHHQRVAAAAAGVGLTPGTPCFPHPILPPPPTRFTTPPVQGIPSPTGHSQPGSNPNHLLDLQPSKESIDAAIGDVLSKPWLPLPLGLKPPAVDSVVVELQRQGIPNIPPAATCSS